MPKGKKFKAATLGGWGIAVNSFTPSKKNLCRKATSAEALHMLVNFSTQDYLFSHFQKFPTFNRTYMKRLCSSSNVSDNSQISCILSKIQSKDKNGIRKLFSRPLVSKDYHKKSKIIYEFIHTFVQLHAKKDAIHKIRKTAVGSSWLAEMLNASKLLNGMVCSLKTALASDQIEGHANKGHTPCHCGQSMHCNEGTDYVKPILGGITQLSLNKKKRTENNLHLYTGKSECMPKYNFVGTFAIYSGIIFLSLTYGFSIFLLIWILQNLNHRVVNHAQPIFLIIVLVGVCCNVSTIIPFLMDESSFASCDKNRFAQGNGTSDDIALFEKECQQLLDNACRSVPFLFMYGFVITYSGLLIKLWRVEKIFNNKKLRRIKINQKHLMFLIVFFLLVTTIVNLYVISSESFADGEGWVWWRMISKIEKADAVCAVLPAFSDGSGRNFCDKYSSQIQVNTIGMCRVPQGSCDGSSAPDVVASFVLCLILIALFLCYSLHIALKTRNIKTSFNEGKFILISLINQSQLIMIIIAVLGQVSDHNSPQHAATYTAFVCCALGLSNMSTLCLIFVPKLIVYYDPKLGEKSFSLRRVPSDSVGSDAAEVNIEIR